jgi:hypothetical protein
VTRVTPVGCVAALLPTHQGAILMVRNIMDAQDGGRVEVPGLWSGIGSARTGGPGRAWRCFALCWSCGRETCSEAATRSEVERPMHWFCSDCEVRWYAYADRVEMPAPAMAS